MSTSALCWGVTSLQAERTPAVKEALKARKEFMTNLRKELVKHKLLHKDVLKDDANAYFHHQVLEYMNLQQGARRRSRPRLTVALCSRRKRVNEGSERPFTVHLFVSTMFTPSCAAGVAGACPTPALPPAPTRLQKDSESVGPGLDASSRALLFLAWRRFAERALAPGCVLVPLWSRVPPFFHQLNGKLGF